MLGYNEKITGLFDSLSESERENLAWMRELIKQNYPDLIRRIQRSEILNPQS